MTTENHKPRYITDQDGVRYDLPEPMREAPPIDTEYWVVDFDEACVVDSFWRSDWIDRARLSTGACFRTREDAEAAGRIWAAIFGGTEEEQK